MAILRLDLFGDFRLATCDGREIRLRMRKAEALLAYLALNADTAHSRETLADLLWDGFDEKRSRQNLRKCLSVIRQALGGIGADIFETVDGNVRLDSDLFDVDVLDFQSKVRARKLNEALADFTYRRLMDSFSVSAEPFETWLSRERARIFEIVSNAIFGHAQELSRTGNCEGAIAAAKKLIDIDPFREDAHRLLMELFLRVGRRAEALHQYDECASLLMSEFGTSPSQDTQTLYDGIAGTVPPPPASDYRPVVVIFGLDTLHGGDIALARGISEDLVEELSRYRWFSIRYVTDSSAEPSNQISRHRLARRYGARFLTEGSLRRDGGQLRISVRLTDAASGAIVWAGRFEESAASPLKSQATAARKIAAQLVPEMTGFEEKRPPLTSENNAWQLWQQGFAALFRFSSGSVSTAKRLFQRSIEADAEFAPAYASLSLAEEHNTLFARVENRDVTLDRAFDLAHTAVLLDPRDSLARYAMGRALIRRQDLDSAIIEMKTAIRLCPSFALARHGFGTAKYYNGHAKEAVLEHLSAARLSPDHPELWAFCHMRARGHFDLAQYEEAYSWAIRACRQPNTKSIAYAVCAASVARLGHHEQARAIVRSLRKRDPTLSIDFILENFGNATIASEIHRLQDAGLS